MIDKVEEARALSPASKPGAMAVYSRVTDPIAAAETLGKFFCQSGMLGVKTPGAGAVIALSCMCEGITPLEFKRTYHIVSGNVTMRSDAMLAEFRKAGGKFKWLNIGEDGEAVIQLEFGGNSIDSKYTMAMAEQAGLIKDGGGWTKNPANMLRARAVSEGVRMIAPEIIAGTYTPEEIEDYETRQQPVDAVDVPYVSEPTAEPVNSDNGEDSFSSETLETEELCSVEQLQEIVKGGELLGQTKEQIASALTDAYEVSKPQDLTFDQARDAIDKLEAGYKAKSQSSQTV